ncbi:MAG TPA: DUF4340 domain-containing protein [Verrucomicrobiota bacterium]|nr:DUF4340 domain-containing protein [Verrucomicrobiota bacterium]HNU49312.1 DUF4340 domain-containing protein [Verrucomicrobiota bacterium]
MNTATTRWLLLGVLILAAFIVFVERRTPGTAEKQARARLVFPELAPRQAARVGVQQGTNFTLRLEREGASWVFRAPFVYPAQGAAVDRLLEVLGQLRWQSRISSQEVLAQTNGLAVYGLDPPAVSLTVEQGSRRHELRLGGRTALGGQVFAQAVGQEGVLTVDAAWLRWLPATVHDWRDTALLPLGLGALDRIEVRPITNGFEVVRAPSNRVWQMARPLPIRADSGKIEYLIRQLELARVSQFVSDDPRVDLEAHGLQPPESELVFGRGTNDLLVLTLGRSPPQAPDQVYARTLAYSNVVLVAREAVAPWLASFREFCDRRMMVFSADAVRRIEIQADERFVVDRVTNDVWRIVEPFAAAADTVLVLEMLQQLAEWEFLRFEREVTTDFAAFDLAPPQRQYTLWGAVTNAASPTNAILAQMQLGRASGATLWARRVPENSVVAVLDNQRLPRAAFELRDRQIWSFDTNQVVSVTIRQLGETRKLVRTGPAQWVLAPGSSGPPQELSLEEAVYRLGRLRADRWVARGEEKMAHYGFGTTDHRIELEVREGDKTRTAALQLGRLTATGRSAYAAVAIDGVAGPVIFECPLTLYRFVQSDLTAVPSP